MILLFLVFWFWVLVQFDIVSYGTGPYYAQFDVRFPDDQGTGSFVVELPSRKELPHSVFTFLEWVGSNLYDGTAFVSQRTGETVLQIDAIPDRSSKWIATYGALGYEESSALGFAEHSAAYVCQRHSMGFLGRGPALAIYMSDDAVMNTEIQSCLGRVIRGGKVLEHVQVVLGEGKDVEIVQVRRRLLTADESARRSDDEL